MSKIKKGMMELEETKRINKELFKIFQEQEQILHQDNERHQQTIRQYQSVNSKFIFIHNHLAFFF
jgi:polyhydroxyalkanoate synthesis regulator phasin